MSLHHCDTCGAEDYSTRVLRATREQYDHFREVTDLKEALLHVWQAEAGGECEHGHGAATLCDACDDDPKGRALNAVRHTIHNAERTIPF